MIVKSTETIILGDYKFSCLIQKSTRRKTLTIKVLSGGVLKVLMPYLMKKEYMEAFLQKNKAWIIEKVEMGKHRAVFQLKYLNGEKHLYLGEEYILSIVPSIWTQVFVLNNNIEVHLAKGNAKDVLEGWYKKQALCYYIDIMEKSVLLFKQYDIKKPNLKIRKMSSRWGSCSKRGNITINYKLIKAPLKCVEFVIIHELCHLIEFNHSKRFYDLLSSVLPDWQQSDMELKKYSGKVLDR